MDFDRTAVHQLIEVVDLPYRLEPDRMVVHVRLTPKGGREALDGVETGADGKSYLKARVSAVPEDGKANAALISMIAKKAGLPKSAVTIIAGETSRMKTLNLSGADAQTVFKLGLST